MGSWLIGVAGFIVLGGLMWRSQPKLAFGALLGLPIAWVLSLLIKPYVTGMTPFPVWLAPLPPALVALTLLVFGVMVWLRADRLPPPRGSSAHEGHGEHGHGHDQDHGGH